MSNPTRTAPAGAPPIADPVEAPSPERLVLRARSGELEIGWSDGLHGSLSGGALRMACRCAACERRRRDGRPATDSAGGVRLVSLEPLGHLGLQLAFSDGHDRGIFPWVYLHRLFAGGATDDHALVSSAIELRGSER